MTDEEEDNLLKKEEQKPKVELEQKFLEERNKWTKEISNCASSIRNLGSMADLQVDLYTKRQQALEYMHQLMDMFSKLNRIYKEKRKEEFEKLIRVDYDVRLKGKENDFILDAKLSTMDYKKDLVRDQINFYRETVKSIDSIIFGLKHRLEAEQYRRI